MGKGSEEETGLRCATRGGMCTVALCQAGCKESLPHPYPAPLTSSGNRTLP